MEAARVVVDDEIVLQVRPRPRPTEDHTCVIGAARGGLASSHDELPQHGAGSAAKAGQTADTDALAAQIAQLQTENELLQAEAVEWQARVERSRTEAAEMQALLAEYERTLSALMASRQAAAPSGDTAAALAAANVALANMRQRHDEARLAAEHLRAHDAVLRTTVAQLQADLAAADARYDELRRHAEARLASANEDVHRLRTGLELEASATRAKLRAAELRVASLEAAVEGKTRENAELVAICDELIAKIDAMGGAADARRAP